MLDLIDIKFLKIVFSHINQ